MKDLLGNDRDAAGPSYVSEDVKPEVDAFTGKVNKSDGPLLSSSDEEQTVPNGPPEPIDWGALIRAKNNRRMEKVYCPGLYRLAKYPKLSAITGSQHYQCLKVLSHRHPHVLDRQEYPPPSEEDFECLENLRGVYNTEQKQYVEWAKSQWQLQYLRAVRPKPIVETVYEAEFKMRASRLTGFPKHFDNLIEIPLIGDNAHDYTAAFTNLYMYGIMYRVPKLYMHELVRNVTIMQPILICDPCIKHPYKFMLPDEFEITSQTINEIHQELAKYAAQRKAKFITSENALQTLVTYDRHWTIPISVYPVSTSEGDVVNTVVLDSEFFVRKEPAMTRTYRAFKHLLRNTLVHSQDLDRESESKADNASKGGEASLPLERMTLKDNDNNESKSEQADDNAKCIALLNKDDESKLFNDCHCAHSSYELPPQRTFKNSCIKDHTGNKEHVMIVHYPHKSGYIDQEVVIEPIPEYQLELGASEMPPDRLRSVIVALMIRHISRFLQVRVDGTNGDIVTYDFTLGFKFIKKHEDVKNQVANILCTVLNYLETLPPGQYVLKHDPKQGSAATLLVAREGGRDFTLECNSSILFEPDEGKIIDEPPVVIPYLLPYHKYRKIMPCAFTPYKFEVAREIKDPKKPRSKKSQQGKKKSKKHNKKK